MTHKHVLVRGRCRTCRNKYQRMLMRDRRELATLKRMGEAPTDEEASRIWRMYKNVSRGKRIRAAK